MNPRVPRYDYAADAVLATSISSDTPNEVSKRPSRPDIMRQYLPAFCIPPNDVLSVIGAG